MSKSNVLSISKSPLFQEHKAHSTSPRKSDPIFTTLRKFGLNPGMVSQLEIYNEAAGEQTIKMFEDIFGNWLECEAEATLQALARNHGAEYKSLHDKFLAVGW